MSGLDVDLEQGLVSFSIPHALYSKQALEIAAVVFEGRVEASCGASGKEFEVELKAKKAGGQAELRALAGEFLNELLNQEYRFIVGRFNGKISRLIVTQALLSARGGEEPKAPVAPTPEFETEVEKMMQEAREEIARTMPKKLAPQGPLMPPEGTRA